MAKEMNMQYEKTSYAGDVQILKREPNEAIPLTLDFDGVTTQTHRARRLLKQVLQSEQMARLTTQPQ